MIYIAGDHRGYELKGKLKQWLGARGYAYEDVGPDHFDSTDDYPDYARAVARKVAADRGSRGIVICGSGIGVAIAANKTKGIRAGTASIPTQAAAAVRDEDMNVLALAADFLTEVTARDIVEAFLGATFSGEERHVRRLKKIEEIEALQS